MTQMLRRGVVPGLVMLVLAAGILMLRDATMSRATPVDEQRDLAVQVRAHVTDEPPEVVPGMVRALVDLCRLQVYTDLVAADRLDADEFRFVLSPTLNDSDRRQLHGCLEDARVQHLQLDVLRMTTM
jgi:hypothetical protein